MFVSGVHVACRRGVAARASSEVGEKGFSKVLGLNCSMADNIALDSDVHIFLENALAVP